MEPFETETIDLSLHDAQTGKPLTASIYRITFDDGSSRTVGIGQLVMALCLARATEKENEVVDMMDKMAVTTTYIESLSTFEQKVVDGEGEPTVDPKTGKKPEGKIDPITIKLNMTLTRDDGTTVLITNGQELLDFFGIDLSGNQTPDDLIAAVESKLDEYNTMSQSQMISLQSETNKRDQSYELISNVLKSFYTVMSGIANNV